LRRAADPQVIPQEGVADHVVERSVKIEIYQVYYERTITFLSLCINTAVINEIVNSNALIGYILA